MQIGRVLLVKPIYYGSHYGDIWLPTGLAYISEALIKANIDNRIIDMGLGYSLNDLKKEIEKYKPQLIGISMMSFGYKHNYEMIKHIKNSYTSIPIVVGGPHMSTLREEVLRGCQSIDFGIALEGEESIIELCQGNKLFSEIKGLLFRDDSGDIRYSGDREFISDLDQNGFPSYSKTELDKYSRSVNIVTSRGCPYHCIYCPVHLAIGRKFRVRSYKSVVEELRYWYERGYRQFGIADDNFSLIRKRVVDICDEIERQGLTGLKISCGNGLRADKVDRDLLARMKEVGFCYIAFGVEGGNNKVLSALRKSEKIETIEQAIKDALDLDYMVTLFFLLGSPGETKADVEDSVRLATKYPVYDVRFYNLIPFQNTELYAWVSKNKYFRKDPVQFISEASHWVNDPIFETPELPIKERKKLYKWANNKVKWHTLKVKKEVHLNDTQLLFYGMGFPRFVSCILSEIYWTVWIRIIIIEPFKETIKRIKQLIR
ncbi:MAG: B12-binding domain-containing radical SAM protein [Candidatus Scalindua sp.]